MATNEDMDLALLTYEELLTVARATGLTNPETMGRQDLVVALRKEGLGIRKSPDQMVSDLLSTFQLLNETIKGMASEIECLRTSKTDAIVSLQVEVAQLKGVVERMQSTNPVPVASPACTDQEKLYSSTARKAASPTGTHTSTDGSTRATTRSSTPTARPDLPSKPQTQDTSTSDNGWQNPHRRRPAQADTNTTGSPLKRTITSQFTKEPARTKRTDLQGVERVKRTAFYLGNVDLGCDAASIELWCKKKDVEVFHCSISESRYFGTAYAHLVVGENCVDKIQGPGFWPDKISIRKWRFHTDQAESEQ